MHPQAEKSGTASSAPFRRRKSSPSHAEKSTVFTPLQEHFYCSCPLLDILQCRTPLPWLGVTVVDETASQLRAVSKHFYRLRGSANFDGGGGDGGIESRGNRLGYLTSLCRRRRRDGMYKTMHRSVRPMVKNQMRIWPKSIASTVSWKKVAVDQLSGKTAESGGRKRKVAVACRAQHTAATLSKNQRLSNAGRRKTRSNTEIIARRSASEMKRLP